MSKANFLLRILSLIGAIFNLPFWYYFALLGPDWYTSHGWVHNFPELLSHLPSVFMALLIQSVFMAIISEDSCV